MLQFQKWLHKLFKIISQLPNDTLILSRPSGCPLARTNVLKHQKVLLVHKGRDVIHACVHGHGKIFLHPALQISTHWSFPFLVALLVGNRGSFVDAEINLLKNRTKNVHVLCKVTIDGFLRCLWIFPFE